MNVSKSLVKFLWLSLWLNATWQDFLTTWVKKTWYLFWKSICTGRLRRYAFNFYIHAARQWLSKRHFSWLMTSRMMALSSIIIARSKVWLSMLSQGRLQCQRMITSFLHPRQVSRFTLMSRQIWVISAGQVGPVLLMTTSILRLLYRVNSSPNSRKIIATHSSSDFSFGILAKGFSD